MIYSLWYYSFYHPQSAWKFSRWVDEEVSVLLSTYDTKFRRITSTPTSYLFRNDPCVYTVYTKWSPLWDVITKWVIINNNYADLIRFVCRGDTFPLNLVPLTIEHVAFCVGVNLSHCFDEDLFLESTQSLPGASNQHALVPFNSQNCKLRCTSIKNQGLFS